MTRFVVKATAEPAAESGQLFDLDSGGSGWDAVDAVLASPPAAGAQSAAGEVDEDWGAELDAAAAAGSSPATGGGSGGGGAATGGGNDGGAAAWGGEWDEPEAEDSGAMVVGAVAEWSVEQVGGWLVAAAKLPQYVAEFKTREIDGFLLSRLARDDLAEMAIGRSALDCTKLLSRRDLLLEAAGGGGGGTGVRASAAAYGDKNEFDGEDEAL